jgi:hypothetical protein
MIWEILGYIGIGLAILSVLAILLLLFHKQGTLTGKNGYSRKPWRNHHTKSRLGTGKHDK